MSRADGPIVSTRARTVMVMRHRGAGFVGALGEAWQHADAANDARLAAAFPHLLEQYGPGSDAWLSVYRSEAKQ